MSTNDSIRTETRDCLICALEACAVGEVPDVTGWELTAPDFDSVATACGLSLRLADWSEEQSEALSDAWSDAVAEAETLIGSAVLAYQTGDNTGRVATAEDVARQMRASDGAYECPVTGASVYISR